MLVLGLINPFRKSNCLHDVGKDLSTCRQNLGCNFEDESQATAISLFCKARDCFAQECGFKRRFGVLLKQELVSSRLHFKLSVLPRFREPFLEAPLMSYCIQALCP